MKNMSLAVLFFAAVPLAAQAPVPVRIPDAPSCSSCTIKVTPIAMLGTAEGPGSLRGMGILRLDGRGRFWALHPPDLPVVFDSLGNHVRTSFRKGSGPGEFVGSAIPIALPGDSTLAIDFPRAALLAPDLTFVRSMPLQQFIGNAIVFRWPDRVVVNGQRPSRDANPQPISLVSFGDGTEKTVSTFGTFPGEPPLQRLELQRSFARAGENFWVVAPRRYRLSEWTTDGRLLRVLERNPQWFDETPGPSLGGPNREPRALITALARDEQGLLWVFISVAAPTWREAWPKLPENAREVSSDAIRHEKLYRTTVEVIDPQQRRLVARTTLNQFLSAAFPGRRAAIYQPDAEGNPRFSIVRLSLEGLPASR